MYSSLDTFWIRLHGRSILKIQHCFEQIIVLEAQITLPINAKTAMRDEQTMVIDTIRFVAKLKKHQKYFSMCKCMRINGKQCDSIDVGRRLFPLVSSILSCKSLCDRMHPEIMLEMNGAITMKNTNDEREHLYWDLMEYGVGCFVARSLLCKYRNWNDLALISQNQQDPHSVLKAHGMTNLATHRVIDAIIIYFDLVQYGADYCVARSLLCQYQSWNNLVLFAKNWEDPHSVLTAHGLTSLTAHKVVGHVQQILLVKLEVV